MARSANKITLVGRCGGDPEVRNLRNGMRKVEINIATNRTRRGEDHTDWFNCHFWDKCGELAEQLLRKGSLVYIEGRMESSHYQDKNGNNRTRWEVSVGTFVPMDGNRSERSASGGGYGGGSKSGNSGSYGGRSGGYGGKTEEGSKGDDWLDDPNVPF